ncbi:hypothetical protein BEK98_06295 [Streptomyces diastatochromogenes]|uniref:Uncharacterized protein n=2 Tax=Streptomyces diastatochromogenes TaxID=42236 RepID=A0A233SS50_STRDA|nr:hypothetical protein BEK98_06295 [Streptomyces diastatochromogenes]
MVPSVNARRFGGLVALLTVVTSGYFTVSSLVDPGGLVPGGDQVAPRTYAAYMAARSIVLLGGMVWLLAIRAWRSLGLLLALNGAVQIVDAVIGAVHQQVSQTIGPLLFATALLTAARLLGVRARPLGRAGSTGTHGPHP